MPDYSGVYLYHCIYEVKANKVEKAKSRTTFGKFRGKLRWVTEAELPKLYQSLQYPEIIEFFSVVSGKDFRKMVSPLMQMAINRDYTTSGILTEITDPTIATTTATNIFEKTVAIVFSKETQIELLKQFINLCYPSIYVTFNPFAKFAVYTGWTKDDLSLLFTCADENNRSALSFKQFTAVLAAIEPCTQHGGVPGEVRCRFMFRFFDHNKDEKLTLAEFRAMMDCLRKVANTKKMEAKTTIDDETLFKSLDLDATKSLTVNGFLTAVGNLKIRGTSQAFRSAASVGSVLRTFPENTEKNSSWDGSQTKPLIASSATRSTLKIDGANKSAPYELGWHMVRLQKSGTEICIDDLGNTNIALNIPEVLQRAMQAEDAKRLSLVQFDQNSVTSELIKCLRYLMQINRIKKQVNVKALIYTWGQLSSNQYAEQLIKVCEEARKVLRAEPRLLQIQPPVYVMGDFHGNCNDLLYFEKVLWHLGPALCPCNLLFLGDYVDRGHFGVEVITYLLCYKVQTPHKMNLLRGNHEIRDIQKMFTFHIECVKKFGDTIGTRVWNAVNSAMDCMPVAAVIEGKVFCCHGGIPPPWLCPTVATINTIPNDLSRPDEQSSLAWELMWNDPVRSKQVTEHVLMELSANEGFAVNVRRGTAHMFSVEALERFLLVNNLSHIIRAHEVMQAGFNIELNGKLLTVFSSSHYCGGLNEAACIMVDQGKLRILKLESHV